MSLKEALDAVNAWLTGSPSLNFLFLLLAIGSLAASIYFFRKSRKEKAPVFLIKTFPLIKDNIAAVEGLHITINDQPIKTLSLARVAFWNKGRDTINAEDIAQSDKLRIELMGDGKIVGSKISFVRKSANSISTTTEGNKIMISFDFLDHLDGCVVDLYHTGSQQAKVIVKGTIKGAAAITKGMLEETFLLERFLDPIFDHLPKPQGSSILVKAAIVVLIVILLPVILPLTAIGILVELFQTVPKDYTLSG